VGSQDLSQENGAPAQSRTGDPRFRKPGAWDDFPKDFAKNSRPLRELYEFAARIERGLSRFSARPRRLLQHLGLYYPFGMSLRDVSELMLTRGIEVSQEAIRLWTLRFGAEYARRLRRTRGRART
jgi:hypothetical protein